MRAFTASRLQPQAINDGMGSQLERDARRDKPRCICWTGGRFLVYGPVSISSVFPLWQIGRGAVEEVPKQAGENLRRDDGMAVIALL